MTVGWDCQTSKCHAEPSR